LAYGLAGVGRGDVQVCSKITAYLCGEGATIAGKETVCVGGRRQVRIKDFTVRSPQSTIGGSCCKQLLLTRKGVDGQALVASGVVQ